MVVTIQCLVCSYEPTAACSPAHRLCGVSGLRRLAYEQTLRSLQMGVSGQGLLDQPMLEGVHGSLGAVRNAELGDDMLNMDLHRGRTDHEG